MIYSIPLVLSGEVFLKEGWEMEKDREKKREEEGLGRSRSAEEGSQD